MIRDESSLVGMDPYKEGMNQSCPLPALLPSTVSQHTIIENYIGTCQLFFFCKDASSAASKTPLQRTIASGMFWKKLSSSYSYSCVYQAYVHPSSSSLPPCHRFVLQYPSPSPPNRLSARECLLFYRRMSSHLCPSAAVCPVVDALVQVHRSRRSSLRLCACVVHVHLRLKCKSLLSHPFCDCLREGRCLRR